MKRRITIIRKGLYRVSLDRSFKQTQTPHRKVTDVIIYHHHHHYHCRLRRRHRQIIVVIIIIVITIIIKTPSPPSQQSSSKYNYKSTNSLRNIY